jgi:hypothetical protein
MLRQVLQSLGMPDGQRVVIVQRIHAGVWPPSSPSSARRGAGGVMGLGFVQARPRREGISPSRPSASPSLARRRLQSSGSGWP